MLPTKFSTERAIGIASIAISALAYGCMAIFARFAYASGANLVGVLIIRFVIAGTLLTLVMLVTKQAWPKGRALLVCVGMGALGYTGQSLCFFGGLKHASAGLIVLLLYLYPTLVSIFSSVFLKEKFTKQKLLILISCLIGLFLTVGGGTGSLIGILFGLGSALVYSVYIMVGGHFLKGTRALASTTVVCLSAIASFSFISIFWQPQWPSTLSGWSAGVAIAIVSTVIAILAFFAGLKRVGASTASIISTLEPVVTVMLAYLVLGEMLSATQLIGGGLIVGSALWATLRS